MTVKELYDWAVRNNAENFEIWAPENSTCCPEFIKVDKNSVTMERDRVYLNDTL